MRLRRIDKAIMSNLYAITPFTQLDYPGELACIAWFSGCNLRCVYCHNKEIITGRGHMADGELISFLMKRRGQLTGVVFSGGEATLAHSLVPLAEKSKSMGYKTKLDTNGTRPDMLDKLLAGNFLDYVALDYKCPPARADKLLGTKKYSDYFETSLKHLIAATHNGLRLEIRTTYHPEFLNEDDINIMIDNLDACGYIGTYYIQGIVAHGQNTFGNVSRPATGINRSAIKKPAHFSLSWRNNV